MGYCPRCKTQIINGSCDCSNGWQELSTMNGTTYPYTATGMYSVDENYVKKLKKEK